MNLRLLTKAGAVFDRILDIFMWTAAAILAVAMLIVSLDVIMRYIFVDPLVWAGEICEYILLGILSLSAAWMLREDGHIKVELVLSILKPRTQILVSLVTSILGAAVFLIVTVFSGETSWDFFRRGVPIARTLSVPKAPLLALIALGSFLLFIQFLRRVFLYLEKWKSPQDKD